MDLLGGPDVVAGAPLTYTLAVQNTGTLAAVGVVLSHPLPDEIVDTGWQSSAGGATARPGSRYVWDLPDLGRGRNDRPDRYGPLQRHVGPRRGPASLCPGGDDQPPSVDGRQPGEFAARGVARGVSAAGTALRGGTDRWLVGKGLSGHDRTLSTALGGPQSVGRSIGDGGLWSA